MKRAHTQYLNNWLNQKDRKPLVLRGARQVGKTWLVRDFAQVCGKTLIEINFERSPELQSLFESNLPEDILINLAAVFKQDIIPNETVLFLDEIQAAPQLLAKLRWFAEDMPELAIIAAGSLLEFVLAEHAFSMPVGRITYVHLEPFTFEEFLLANQGANLLAYIQQFNFNKPIPQAIHSQLMSLFKEYLIIGGMPAVVSSWVSEKSLQRVQQIQHDIMATYRDDFAKYHGRLPINRLEEVIMSVPKMLGQKFVYSRVNATAHSSAIRQALDLLIKARVCTKVKGTAANGVPLEAEIKDNYLKMIFLDIGLCCSALGITLNQLLPFDEINLINKGSLAEQVVGQLLRSIYPPYIEPNLYYWLREEKQSNAELDYVIQFENKIIPVEVKAGKTGTLKSLQTYIKLKNSSMAIRTNSDFPSITYIDNCKLLSIPFYLIGQINRLLNLD